MPIYSGEAVKLYKLTDANLKTYNGFTYRFGETATAPGVGQLCTAGWLHAYTHPALAVFLNPIHAAIENPRLFWFDGSIGIDDGFIVGVREITLFPENELPVPKLTKEQIIRFGMLCAQKVYPEGAWRVWSENWLSGKDRTKKSARAIIDIASNCNFDVFAILSAKAVARAVVSMHDYDEVLSWAEKAVVEAAEAIECTPGAPRINLTEIAEMVAPIK